MQKIKTSFKWANNYGNTVAPQMCCAKKRKRDSSKGIHFKVGSTYHNSHEKLSQEKVPWSNKFKILYTIFFAGKKKNHWYIGDSG